MRKTLKFLIASGACLVMAGTGQMSAQAAMNLETDAPVAGASVAINNYYASSLNPEKELAEAFASKEVLAVAGAGQTGVAGGALMAAINVLTDFGNPLVIGGDLALLPTEAYMQIVGWYDMKTASILATVLLLPSFAIFAINRFWVGRRSYVTVTGKEISLHPYPVPRLVKWACFGFCMLVSVFVLLVYGTLFVGAFTKTWGYDWSFTAANFRFVWDKFTQIWNSIKFALLSAGFASLLAMALAYIVQKKPVGVNKLLDFLAVLPSAVPGMFLGLSYVIAFNAPPLKLTNTGFIMVLALMFWNLPTCYSASIAGIQQIGDSV